MDALRRRAALEREDLAEALATARDDAASFRNRWRFAGWAASGARGDRHHRLETVRQKLAGREGRPHRVRGVAAARHRPWSPARAPLLVGGASEDIPCARDRAVSLGIRGGARVSAGAPRRIRAAPVLHRVRVLPGGLGDRVRVEDGRVDSRIAAGASLPLNLGEIGVLAAMWALARRGPLPPAVLRSVDGVGNVLVSYLVTGMCFAFSSDVPAGPDRGRRAPGHALLPGGRRAERAVAHGMDQRPVGLPPSDRHVRRLLARRPPGSAARRRVRRVRAALRGARRAPLDEGLDGDLRPAADGPRGAPARTVHARSRRSAREEWAWSIGRATRCCAGPPRSRSSRRERAERWTSRGSSGRSR